MGKKANQRPMIQRTDKPQIAQTIAWSTEKFCIIGVIMPDKSIQLTAMCVDDETHNLVDNMLNSHIIQAEIKAISTVPPNPFKRN